MSLTIGCSLNSKNKSKIDLRESLIIGKWKRQNGPGKQKKGTFSYKEFLKNDTLIETDYYKWSPDSRIYPKDINITKSRYKIIGDTLNIYFHEYDTSDDWTDRFKIISLTKQELVLGYKTHKVVYRKYFGKIPNLKNP